ncbi:MAG TPA: hypothetical protein VMW63_10605 [Methanoregulaceae archaeon]|nr:hypothetical protein [Methanoregulaceae archaeon]
MAKKLSFQTVSLGTEPSVPKMENLAGWISGRRGRETDLVAYFLENGLLPQIQAKIGNICAGGRFYGKRWLECLTGVEGTQIVGEPGSLPGPVINDALDINDHIKDARVAVPAPHLLGLKDTYFGDDDEMQDALAEQYRNIMRAMRDSGIAGHVLHCDRIIEHELEQLASKKVFFHPMDVDRDGLQTLLEYQRIVALEPSKLHLVEEVEEEYEIDRIVLLHPSTESLAGLLRIRDPDKISTGGYCIEECHRFWDDLVSASVIVR